MKMFLRVLLMLIAPLTFFGAIVGFVLWLMFRFYMFVFTLWENTYEKLGLGDLE